MFHVVVDAQVDFMLPSGKLYVPGAETIIPNLCEYLTGINKNDDVLFTYDTHVKSQYEGSEESKSFPLHCEIGTIGHKLVVPSEICRGNTFYFFKNIFSMWDAPDSPSAISNLDFSECQYNASREKFINEMADKHSDVMVSGVASDFCVISAIKGFVKRGFNVKVDPRLCRGINKTIEEVREEFGGCFDLASAY